MLTIFIQWVKNINPSLRLRILPVFRNATSVNADIAKKIMRFGSMSQKQCSNRCGLFVNSWKVI